MYRYIDGKGNVFSLDEEGPSMLGYGLSESGGALASHALSSTDYMRLVSAFTVAIDNKLCQCELRPAAAGMITALQEGQLRRYILRPGCSECTELEELLQGLTAARSAQV